MSDTNSNRPVNRRDFLVQSGAAAALAAVATPRGGGAQQSAPVTAPAAVKRPVGIELYAVRKELAKDIPNTLRTIRSFGYEAVEFYSPYVAWTLPYAKTIRTMLDDLGLRCLSTHNDMRALLPGETMTKAIELNQILGANYIVLASSPTDEGTAEEWKRVCGELSTASATLAPHGLYAGFHNHGVEWKKFSDGTRPMDIIAANTPTEFMLQLDVGHCIEGGGDPVAWINANPGRIRSVHVKDWAPGTDAQEKSFRVLFGEGVAPWRPIVTALEATGGVECYLMEQEGSRFSEFETARRCLASWRAFRRAG